MLGLSEAVLIQREMNKQIKIITNLKIKLNSKFIKEDN